MWNFLSCSITCHILVSSQLCGLLTLLVDNCYWLQLFLWLLEEILFIIFCFERLIDQSVVDQHFFLLRLDNQTILYFLSNLFNESIVIKRLKIHNFFLFILAFFEFGMGRQMKSRNYTTFYVLWTNLIYLLLIKCT